MSCVYFNSLSTRRQMFPGLRKAIYSRKKPIAAARLGTARQGAEAASDAAEARPDDGGRPPPHHGPWRPDRQSAATAQNVLWNAAAANDGGRRPWPRKPIRTAVRTEAAKRTFHDQAGVKRGACRRRPDEEHAAIWAAIQPVELDSLEP